ncbi:MAG: hypothetical protein H0T79_08120 [Deltaproteobacteria bacterium]|nr:hypothetical protein [Deltaproteobacteria bacterium]
MSGGFVYWSDQAWEQTFPATINRVSVGGGNESVVATGSEPQESQHMKVFAVDATSAYYVDHEKLMKAPLAGGPAVIHAFVPSSCPEGKMAAVGGNVYWTDVCANVVYRVFE